MTLVFLMSHNLRDFDTLLFVIITSTLKKIVCTFILHKERKFHVIIIITAVMISNTNTGLLLKALLSSELELEKKFSF